MNNTKKGLIPTEVIEWVKDGMNKQKGRISKEESKGYVMFSGLVDTYTYQVEGTTNLATPVTVQEWLDSPLNIYLLMEYFVNN